MTQLVSELLLEALAARELPDAAAHELDAARFHYRSDSQPQPQKEAA